MFISSGKSELNTSLMMSISFLAFLLEGDATAESEAAYWLGRGSIHYEINKWLCFEVWMNQNDEL